jgi:hypothetical protein
MCERDVFILSPRRGNVCKRERMQLQEEKCRTGLMQLKLKSQIVLGVRPPFCYLLSALFGVCV